MFCCLGFKADRSLHERDMQMMKVFADLAAFEIGRELEAAKVAQGERGPHPDGDRENQISIVYQPIWDLDDRRPVGFECLARFSAAPSRSPDSGSPRPLKRSSAYCSSSPRSGSRCRRCRRSRRTIYLAVNASPRTILSGELLDVLDGMPAERIVLEITEHAHVEDYDRLLDALQPLRARGVRLAVDDAGAGYSSLQHILQLQPDLIKLDMGLTRNIDLDPARRALAAALVAFARDTGSEIIAEGVETTSELDALRRIGVEKAQGYFLGRPMPFDDAVKLAHQTRRGPTASPRA